MGLSDKSISAFATEVGSRTSHTSIVARSMDVPAVVGCEALYQRAGHNDTIIVDGLSGTVTLHPNENQIAIARAKQQRFDAFSDILKEQAFGVAKTERRSRNSSIRKHRNAERSQECDVTRREWDRSLPK